MGAEPSGVLEGAYVVRGPLQSGEEFLLILMSSLLKYPQRRQMVQTRWQGRFAVR
jgi:hypothetical protein